MRVIGAPTIRVVDCGDQYFAIEGTHRIEAARLLLLPVVLDVCQEHDLIAVKGLDIEVNWEDVPDGAITAKEVVGSLQAECNGEYMIDAEGKATIVRTAKYPPIPPP
jgi:hypothetical protein